MCIVSILKYVTHTHIHTHNTLSITYWVRQLPKKNHQFEPVWNGIHQVQIKLSSLILYRVRLEKFYI